MDEISIESSESQNSSCSVISYQGTDGYISDGEDPFFIHPPEEQELQQEQEMQETHVQTLDQDESQIQDIDQISQSSKTDLVDYQQKKMRRQKEIRYKEIMDELKFGRNTTLLLNRNPAVPTYDEIIKIINQIKAKYSKRSLKSIIQKLHYVLIQKKKEEQRSEMLSLESKGQAKRGEQKQQNQLWLRQRRLTAQAFVQLGYGITKMRKFIQQNAINLQIQIQNYDNIIKKLLFDAYHRLLRFLRKKCHKRLRAIKNQTEEKFLLEVLKSCKRHLDTFEIHNFYKLIKMTYMPNETFKISKRIASRLYHTVQEYISRKKVKQGLLNPDDHECQVYNDQMIKWSEQMIQKAIDSYIKQGSLNRVREIMSKLQGMQQYLLDNRSIKYHLQIKMKAGIETIKTCLLNDSQRKNGKVKDMMQLNAVRLKWIMTDLNATNVRVVLCQIYKARKNISVALLKQAVLTINEYVLAKEKHQMQQEINRTQREYDPYENQFHRRRRSKRNHFR